MDGARGYGEAVGQVERDGGLAGSRLWQALVERLVRRAQRTPYLHLDGYMERFWLFRSRWLSGRIHNILRSDLDRDLHDHPWHYATVILRGGYVEVTEAGERWYGPGSVLLRRATHLHRLVLPPGVATTTLFVHTRKRRDWGFATASGWVHWRRYVEERGEEAV
ncbi:MAG: hypothetical protein AB1689_14195 [Thermodesulfobacteriota bacterium]